MRKVLVLFIAVCLVFSLGAGLFTSVPTVKADTSVAGEASTVALPDLTVDTLFFAVDTLSFDPAPPIAGGSVAFCFTVHNQGSAPVPAGYVFSVYVDGAYLGQGTGSNGIASGASEDWGWVDMTWPVDTASHTFMVVLDPNDAIVESNESNNSASISASAAPVPVTGITVTGVNCEVVNNYTFVPIKPIAETLGAIDTWLPDTQGMTIVLGDTIIGLQIGNTTAVLDANIIALDAAPYLNSNSDVMVPISFIFEAFGTNQAIGAMNSVIGATTVVNNGTLQMLAAVLPTNATGPSITWSVVAGTGTATIDSTGVLTATGVGTVTVTATNAASGVTRTEVITVTTAPTTYTAGDVDGDGTVTMLDALVAARTAVGMTTLTGSAFQAADVNHDGTITMMDVLLIARIAVS